MNKDCPCGNKAFYKSCCGIAHNNINAVQTAEQLMRSRYTAFTMANGSYLMLSHHSSTRPNKKEEKAMVSWAKEVSWIRLEVIESTKGDVKNTEGTVRFKAYFYENGEVAVIHENSAFKKENGQWMYVGLAN